MKLEKRKDMYRLGNENGGIYFYEHQLETLGYWVPSKQATEIVLKEFCVIDYDNDRIYRKDNDEKYISISRYYIKNNRHYYC